ncbi:MAG: hypothetical protein QG670_2525 [Thermoproteota archaeon]|nr:hypothetical protein [Thermoproteota archaeon]
MKINRRSNYTLILTAIICSYQLELAYYHTVSIFKGLVHMQRIPTNRIISYPYLTLEDLC